MDGVDDVLYVPVPCVCKGIITNKLDGTETYEVSIYNSPIGQLNDVIHASLIEQPGQGSNFKSGTFVKVLVTMDFGGTDNKFIGVHGKNAHHIIGSFTERSVANLKVENPLVEDDEDRVRWIHPKSEAGMVASEDGKVTVASGGSIFSLWSPFGFGVFENCHRTMAQNHQRVISHNPSLYLAKEYFGMFAGSSIEDKAGRISEEDFPINYRRFVTQNKSANKWVSTCEGSWAPWVGANNNFEEVPAPSKEALFSKAINYEDSRITIEAGEPGDSFINIRIDDVVVSEKTLPGGSGALPALVGNRAKIQISDKGAMEIRLAGKGVPNSNVNGFHMSVDENGKLIIHAAAGVEITHGDADSGINSISMDPAKGIDIVAQGGLRVNGKKLINENFFNWFQRNAALFIAVTGSPGGPSPLSPIALADMNSSKALPDSTGGFTTKNLGLPASKIINDSDTFTSV